MNTSSTTKYKDILLGGVSAVALTTTAHAQDGGQDAAQAPATQGVDTVIVTATKRAQNVQDIASTVQAISGAAIAEMGAHNAEDYMRFIPSVQFTSYTPGSNEIVFRGITIGTGSYIGQAAASMYLDETSLTSSGDQPDVRMIDIASVEALSGPQGTLYGDSAQAGVLRITTNKPVMNEWQVVMEGGLRKGSKSELSYDVSAVFNVPVVEDRLAFRFVAEKARDGGFINNVLGYTPDGHADYFYNGVIQDQFNWGVVNNANIVENRWNDVDYITARASAKLALSEDWEATFTIVHQENESTGDNGYNPFVGDLEVVQFNPNLRKDKWNMYSMTLEGDLGWAQLVSSTSFYKRDIWNDFDVTTYGKYYALWACYTYYEGGAAYSPRYCLGPNPGDDVLSTSSYPAWQDKFAQEVRLSGTAGPFDWLIGAYYEDSTDAWDGYFNAPQNFDYQDSLSLAYWEDFYGETYPGAIAPWGSSDDTEWQQHALFGEATWHIADTLHLTVGARWFNRKNSKFYKAFQPDTKLGPDFVTGPASVANTGDNTEFVPKVSLAWDWSDDNMIYGLYTKGYRPGGTNRSRGDLSRLVFPTVYGPDIVTNYEFGSKNKFFDNRLQLNMSYYYMKWEDYQLQVTDPSFQGCADSPEEGETVFCDQPWQSVVVNSPGGAHTEGIEVDFVFAPSDQFTIGGNVTHLTAVTDGPFDVAGIMGGVALPNVPKWKGSVWASYYWPVEFVSGGEMFIRAQHTHKGKTFNRLVGSTANPILENASYGITDLSAGILAHDDGWEFHFYINNLSDTRANYQNSTGTFDYPFSNSGAMGGAPYTNYQKLYTNRPMEFGARVKFNY